VTRFLPQFAAKSLSELRLSARLGVIAAILIVETLTRALILDGLSVDLGGAEFNDARHWLFRFCIAYAGAFTILAYFSRRSHRTNPDPWESRPPVRLMALLVHGVSLLALELWSAQLYQGKFQISLILFSTVWSVASTICVVSLFATLAPLRAWWGVLLSTRPAGIHALLPAAVALLAFKGSQTLWASATSVTFWLVRVVLKPFYPMLRTDTVTQTLSTDHFAVTVTSACSGLEGVALILVFCTAWLWYFRDDFYFPRSLIVVPLAAVAIFVLNAFRIGALLAIGDAGYARIASVGFHSQAGWISFNCVALTFAVVARGSPWLNRRIQHAVAVPARSETLIAEQVNPAAPYLMPFLTILAVGMLTRAVTADFDSFYPLRFACAAAALWVFRETYRSLNWHFSWRGPCAGAATCLIWVLMSNQLIASHGPPEELSGASAAARFTWIFFRAAGSILTVPVAEELAFRGYLLRRLMGRDFDTLPFHCVRWPALLLSACAFGVGHGQLWLPSILAGVVYGFLAKRTGTLGESVAAHATTNALLAAYVLKNDQWQLW